MHQSVHADSVFSNYDFTFYDTVSQSLAIMDSSTIGFDYTGFGFVGTRNTNGLFVRIGLQLPYTTLENIFVPDSTENKQDEESGENPQEGFDIVAGTSDDMLENEYRFTLILGPAVRQVFSPHFDFYAGFGLKLEEHITTETSRTTGSSTTAYSTLLALDYDLGFKFNIESNKSIRFGLYGTYEILGYDYRTSTDSEGRSSFSTSDIHLNVIASGDSRVPMSVVGYVSMGMTFNSEVRQDIYRYETTSAQPGEGSVTTIGQE